MLKKGRTLNSQSRPRWQRSPFEKQVNVSASVKRSLTRRHLPVMHRAPETQFSPCPQLSFTATRGWQMPGRARHTRVGALEAVEVRGRIAVSVGGASSADLGEAPATGTAR